MTPPPPPFACVQDPSPPPVYKTLSPPFSLCTIFLFTPSWYKPCFSLPLTVRFPFPHARHCLPVTDTLSTSLKFSHSALFTCYRHTLRLSQVLTLSTVYLLQTHSPPLSSSLELWWSAAGNPFLPNSSAL